MPTWVLLWLVAILIMIGLASLMAGAIFWDSIIEIVRAAIRAGAPR